MHLAHLPSIYNTIQSNSDISSLNVWTTLCLSHSMLIRWSVKRTCKSPFPYTHTYVFFSKQLLKAQLYTLNLSEDAAIQVAVALWKGEKISQLCWIRHKEGVMLRDWLSRGSWHMWHTKEAGMTLLHISDNPPLGLGTSLHLKQQALRLQLLSRGLHRGYMARGH